ncbi:MAG: aspartate aminotransferase family protein [Spirochaetes bacterium]|jgi:adenosylmethionine-8-amino-7-oxononanoate aminotransferase|nr:aspartate aminotransferase family protein [Spirochaetota bacterium]
MDTSHLILHKTPRSAAVDDRNIIIRGEGVYVWDRGGNRYLDLDSGVTRPVHVGHGREDLARAVYDQIIKLSYFTPCGYANEPALELSGVLTTIAPRGINNFVFECSGSEAVESAMKLAKQHFVCRGEEARYKVISRKGAYHGVNGLGLRALGTMNPMRQLMEPLTPGGLFAESPYCYRCPYRMSYPACELHCAREVERLVEFEKPESISAFIGEPIQQGFGVAVPPDGYWPAIQKICRDHGILMIMDEVICGFGRTGRMFGTEHFDVSPDMITMAKGISSGCVPLSAVGCTDEVLAPVDIFNHLHTYGNHPVACAAGIKNIQILREERMVENAEQTGRYFLDGLKALETRPTVGEARGKGLWLALDMTLDKRTRSPFPEENLAGIVSRAKQKGIIMKFMGSALEFAPPLIITRQDIDGALAVIDECVAEEEKVLGFRS